MFQLIVFGVMMMEINGAQYPVNVSAEHRNVQDCIKEMKTLEPQYKKAKIQITGFSCIPSASGKI